MFSPLSPKLPIFNVQLLPKLRSSKNGIRTSPTIRHQKSSPVCGRNLELSEENNIVKGFAACIFVLDSRKCGTSSPRKHADNCGNKPSSSIEQYFSNLTLLSLCGVQGVFEPKIVRCRLDELRGRYSVVAASVQLVKCYKATQFCGNVCHVLHVSAF